jgi:hypothetical protein
MSVLPKVVVFSALDGVEDDVAITGELEGVLAALLGRRGGGGDAEEVERVVEGAGDGGDVGFGEGTAVRKDCEKRRISGSRKKEEEGGKSGEPAKANSCIP